MTLILVVDEDRRQMAEVGMRASGSDREILWADHVASAIGQIVDREPDLVFVAWTELSAELIREVNRLPDSIARPQIIFTIDCIDPGKRPAMEDMAERYGAAGILQVPCTQQAIRRVINLAIAVAVTPSEPCATGSDPAE